MSCFFCKRERKKHAYYIVIILSVWKTKMLDLISYCHLMKYYFTCSAVILEILVVIFVLLMCIKSIQRSFFVLAIKGMLIDILVASLESFFLSFLLKNLTNQLLQVSNLDIFNFICFNLIIVIGSIAIRIHILSKPDSLQKTWGNPSNLVTICYMIHLSFVCTTIILLFIHIIIFIVWIPIQIFSFLSLIIKWTSS